MSDIIIPLNNGYLRNRKNYFRCLRDACCCSTFTRFAQSNIYIMHSTSAMLFYIMLQSVVSICMWLLIEHVIHIAGYLLATVVCVGLFALRCTII